MGPAAGGNELKKRALHVSAAGVRCVWQRHDLETLPKRLKALEAKSAQEGLLLSERQLAALEKAKTEKEAHGEFEANALAMRRPGHLVCRHAQRRRADLSADLPGTYTKLAFAKLYDRKTPLVAADLLNDRVIPFFDEQQIPLGRVLTDRGTEYCGAPERHEYELYLAVENIDHTRTKVKSPQTNGIVERFHRTVLNEFYKVAFRRKIYAGIEQLQADLDGWLKEYNELRPHQGRWCYGKTPRQTFIDAIVLAQEKILSPAVAAGATDGIVS